MKNSRNRKLIKASVTLFSCLLLALFGGQRRVYASEEFDIQSQYEASGAEDAFDRLPESVREELDSAGIDAGDITTAQTLQPAGVNTLAGQKLPHEQRDEMRAAIVRKTLFPA